MLYPSREFILANPIKFKRPAIDCILAWRKQNKNHQYNQVKQLLHQLAKIYGINISVCFEAKAFSATCRKTSNGSSYIVLNNSSIISALHEFAHALYGRSESIACRWSIWLFKTTFPQAMEHLVWDGHMLKRRKLDASKKSSPTPAAIAPSCQRPIGFA